MCTQTHTHTLIKDQMTPWLRHIQRESFALPKLELSYLLVFLSASMPPMHKHTAPPGYIQCHHIQTFLSTAPLSHEVCSSPALRGKEPLGPDQGDHSTQRAQSKQAEHIRSLRLLQGLPGTRGSWWQLQQPGPMQVRPTRGHKSAQMEGGHSSSTGGPFMIPTVATASSSVKGEGLFQGQARPWLPSYTAQARDLGVSVLRHKRGHILLPPFPSTGRGWITRLCSPVF